MSKRDGICPECGKTIEECNERAQREIDLAELARHAYSGAGGGKGGWRAVVRALVAAIEEGKGP